MPGCSRCRRHCSNICVPCLQFWVPLTFSPAEEVLLDAEGTEVIAPRFPLHYGHDAPPLLQARCGDWRLRRLRLLPRRTSRRLPSSAASWMPSGEAYTVMAQLSNRGRMVRGGGKGHAEGKGSCHSPASKTSFSQTVASPAGRLSTSWSCKRQEGLTPQGAGFWQVIRPVRQFCATHHAAGK